MDSFYQEHQCERHYLPKFPHPCKICYEQISSKDFADGLCYTCTKMAACIFMIHKSCAETTQRHIQNHPFHPQHHHLALSYQLCSTEIYDACGHRVGDPQPGGWSWYMYMYKCSSSHCSFLLHVKCASLTPTIGKNGIESGHAADHNHCGDLQLHPHLLIPCIMGKNFTYSCTFCTLPFIGDKDDDIGAGASTSSLLVCLECKALLHKSCAKMPWNIEQHPFHPSHPLVLLPPAMLNTTGFICNVCRLDRWNCFTYHCQECDFHLDVHCAHLKPKRNNGNGDDFPNHNKVQRLNHFHPLIVCEDEKMAFPRTFYVCGGCRHRFCDVDTIYFCPECECLVDKSCADLPQDIKHVLHPEHELTLVLVRKKRPHVLCPSCLYILYGFCYQCYKCKFYLDIKCAMSKHTILTSRLHRHPLVLHKESQSNECNICLRPCHTPFFRCLLNDFVVHVHCIKPLPTKVKSRHRHSLTLSYSQRKDRPNVPDDEEFYCNACEERRVLEDPSYYCESENCGGYIAHQHCVVNEIVEFQETGWSSNQRCEDANELEATFQDFKDSFTSEEKLQVETVLQVYEEKDHSDWLRSVLQVHKEKDNSNRLLDNFLRVHDEKDYSDRLMNNFLQAFGKKGVLQENEGKDIPIKKIIEEIMRRIGSENKKLRFPWESWDAKSKVIKIDTGIWILEEFAPILTAFFTKHGNFCCYSNLSPKPKMFYVTTVCEVLHNMSLTYVIDATPDLLATWFQGLVLGKQAGFEIGVAFECLSRVMKTHFSHFGTFLIDPNFAGVRVREDEVTEFEERSIQEGDWKSKVRKETKELGKEIEKLEKTLEEKRPLYDLKTSTLNLIGEKAILNLLL